MENLQISYNSINHIPISRFQNHVQPIDCHIENFVCFGFGINGKKIIVYSGSQL